MSTHEIPISPSIDATELSGTRRTSRRYLAACMDSLLAIVCFGCVIGVFKSLLPKSRSAEFDVIIGVFACVLYFLYYFIPEAFFSTTPGKTWCGLCVRHIDGSKCSMKGAFIRTLTRIFEVNPLFGALPAIITVFMTKRRQRIGDILAGTVVVEKRVADAALSANSNAP